MNEPSANPVWVTLLFVARCGVPILLLIGISYVIKKLGLVVEPPKPPSEEESQLEKSNKGGFSHGAT